jgi:uncharacterized protein YacL (UPF0231 family)
MDVWTMQMKLDHIDIEIWMNENNKDEYDKLDNINDIYKKFRIYQIESKENFSLWMKLKLKTLMEKFNKTKMDHNR